MLWSTRPDNELPVLMITMNNGWGISTAHCTQQACEHTIERGKPFGIPGDVVDGNDPVASWFAIEFALQHCRLERKPYMLEAMVSRLHGHSSSSGAPRSNDPDCVALFESRLLDAQLLDHAAIDQVHDDAKAEVDAAVEQAMQEPMPRAEDVEKYTYAPSAVDQVYPDDYTGLPSAK
jgi:2-oxoisovalerate dehydrogenase E1 component alpha subunit